MYGSMTEYYSDDEINAAMREHNNSVFQQYSVSELSDMLHSITDASTRSAIISIINSGSNS